MAASGGGGIDDARDVCGISFPDGDVMIGGIFDFSGSMRKALGQGASRCRRENRTSAVFNALRTLGKVAEDEWRRKGREVLIFACAVGIHGLGARKSSCDLVEMLEHSKDLLYAREYTVSDLIRLAHEIGDRGRASDMWIRENVREDEASDLMRYLSTHRNDAERIVAELPSEMLTSGVETFRSSQEILGLVAGAVHGGVRDGVFGVYRGAIEGSTSWRESARARTAAPETHPAMVLKREFLAKQRQEPGPDGCFRPEMISEVPSPRRVQDANEMLRSVRADHADQTLVALEPFVYGSTPLGKGLEQAVSVFSSPAGDRCKQRQLFILSDGFADDPDLVLSAAHKLEELGVSVVCCFLTDASIESDKTLFDREQDSWSDGERLLFRISTKNLHCAESPISLLVHQGWAVPTSGRCRLFCRTNNLEAVENFHAVLFSGIVSHLKDSTLGIAERLDWAKYNVSQTRGDSRAVYDQKQTGTCWAHAIATAAYHATRRVIGREGGYPTFENIRDEMFKNIGRGSIGDVAAALHRVLPQYRLRTRTLDEDQARMAVIRHRPIVTTCCLKHNEWNSFRGFFRRSPSGVLRAEQVLDQEESGPLEGHVVLLIDIGPEFLEFLNSWGEGFGNRGRFRIYDSKVMRHMTFYDVYWTQDDLVESEKTAFETHRERLLDEIQTHYPTLALHLNNHHRTSQL